MPNGDALHRLVAHLWCLEDWDTPKWRLGQEFRRLAVAGMVKLSNFDFDAIVFRSNEDLERAEVRWVRPKLLLRTKSEVARRTVASH